ncbi:MAG: HD domain-containing protein [Cryomorphaceae bacterium]|nr:HD domain-containing protein [Cryomorphaceae bacterium]
MSIKEVFDHTYKTWIPRLQNELSPNLKYHTVKHTLSVLDSCEEIGRAEGIDQTEMFLLKTAAVLHDCGFLESPEEHEQRGCKFAREFLRDTVISDEQIEWICSMIMATKIPQSPKMKLDEILCDADLAYLGTDNYTPISDKLRTEIELLGTPLSEEKWLNIQIGFLESHHFFTQFAIDQLSEKKEEHLSRLKEELSRLSDK